MAFLVGEWHSQVCSRRMVFVRIAVADGAERTWAERGRVGRIGREIARTMGVERSKGQ